MVIVITGASGGIGLGMARAFINRGHTVYSFSRSAPSDTQIKHIPCDVSDPEKVKEAFAGFFELESRIDMLINNAGIGISGSCEFTATEDMKKIFDTNFFGAVYCTQCVVQKMREQQSGKIIFISSVGAIFTLPFQTFYSATKIALNSFAEGLLMELKTQGVKVGTVLPGDIASNFTQNRKKDCSGQDVYGARIEKSIATMERDERNGVSADQAGATIAKYLCKRKLKYYKVLGLKYKFLCMLNKILPRKTVIKILYKMYG